MKKVRMNKMKTNFTYTKNTEYGSLKYDENERKVYFMSPTNTILYIVDDVNKPEFDCAMHVNAVEIYSLLCVLSLNKINTNLKNNGNYIFTCRYSEVELPYTLIFDLLRFTTVIKTSEFIKRALKEG